MEQSFLDLTVLLTVAKNCGLTKSEDACQQLLPHVIDAVSHRVPNVRFLACKAFDAMASLVDDENKAKVATLVSSLCEDKDMDVRRAASATISKFGGSLQGNELSEGNSQPAT